MGVWFSFRGDGRVWTLSTCNELTRAVDTVIFVFSGQCGSLSCEVVNDDTEIQFDLNPFCSEMTLTTVAGTDYLVFVRSYDLVLPDDMDFGITALASGTASCFPECLDGYACNLATALCECKPDCSSMATQDLQCLDDGMSLSQSASQSVTSSN